MVYDQAQSPRLGQRTPVESTYVRMFSGGEVPEAAWPGQLIYINEDQILQIYNGDAWEDVTGGDLGQLTFVGPTPPTAQHIGDVWYNTSDGNRMYLAKSVGADQIAPGEWELVSAAAPPLVPGTHIYHQDTPPGPADVPPPANNDFWYETPGNHQYYYSSAAPGTHWIFVQDTGIPAAIKSTLTEFAVNSSETVAPTTGWSVTTPTRAPGTFVWFRTTTTKNDNTSTTTNPALLTGNTGATGPQGTTGSQGVPGPPGASGTPVYTWVKYADTPTTGMSDDPTGKKYMGLSYNQASSTESNIYADYAWSLITGADGVAGPPGADGQPTYTWIKYGTSATGAGLQDSPTGMTYMGISYNKLTPTESNVPTDYEWSLIQGPQGAQGPQGNQGSQGIQGPAGSNGQTLYTWIKYADSPTTGMVDLPAGKAYMGIAYNKTTPTESSIYGDYEWNLTQGAQGNQGIPGAAGANGVPVYTWVKYANNATPTSGQMSDDPTGMVYMGLSYNQLSATEGTDYHAYSWSLIQGPQGPAGSTGNTGAPGAPGSSVGTVTPYWATVNYGASGPAKPTTATPIAPWVTTEPAFSVGTEQWRTEKTTLTDTTFSYSTPYKSSMYGAVATDRIAPSSSPTPEVIPGIGAFFLRWPAVANHDPVTYDVHISDTSGFTPGPTTLYDSTTAYSMTIRHLVPIDPNTTLPFPLLYDDPPGTKPYFFKIVARDADGSAPASAQVNQGLPAITSTDITARSVKADSIVTGSLTGDLFSGTVVLGSTISTGVIGADGQIAGARVDLGPLGLVVYDSTGTPITGFPLDPSQDAFVKQAHFDMLSADVQDNFSMHGKNNQLATESELTIAAGVTPPNAQPTVTVFYDQIQLDRNTAVRSNTPNPYYDLGTFALDPSQICAMAWINAWGGYWAVIQEKSNGLRFWRFNPNGTIFNNPVNGRPWVDDFNDRSNGGTCYDSAFSDSAFMFKQGVSGYYIIGYPPAGGNAITNTIPAGWILDSDTRPPTLAFDSIANRYILFQSTGGANGTWSARRFHLVAGSGGNLGAASSTGDGAVITGPASSGNSQRVNGLVYGNQIPGGSSYRYAISLDATLGIAVWDSAITARKLVDGSYEEWSKATPSLGFCHDGTQFCSVDATGKITKYTSWNWPQANAVSYIGASAIATVPSPDYETPIGAQYAKFTSPRRAKIRIKMPETDGDGTDNRANKWGLYWYRGTSDPTTGAVFKQIGLIGSSTLPTTIDVTADPTGAPPPYGLQGKLDSINNPSGNFPAANPASIQSSALLGGNPTIALNGDGSGRLGQAYWDTNGNWSGIAGGSGGGSLDTYTAAATASLTLTNVDADITGMSVPVSVAGPSDRFLVVAAVDFRATTSTTVVDSAVAVGKLLVDGVIQAGQAVFNSGSTTSVRATVHQNWMITGMSAGTHTVSMKASENATSGSITLGVAHTKMVIVKLVGPTGPQGAKGDKGDQGLQGLQGVQGPTGLTGNQGATGSQGPIGNTGAQGPQGTTGATGSQGIQGPIGNTGAQGTPGEKWFTGAGAPAGATGIVGDWDLDSANGDFYEKTGASAWTLRGNLKGPQGIQGIQGVTGTTGSQGPQGATGNTGNTGAQGPQGATGATGIAEAWYSGNVAPTGSVPALAIVGDWYLDTVTGFVYEKTSAGGWTQRASIMGPQGIQGATGATGATGSTGAQGPPGAGGGSSMAVVDETTTVVPLATQMTFRGTGVTAALGAAGEAVVTIPTPTATGTAGGDLTGTYPNPTVPALANKIDTSSKGAANGVAGLDSASKVAIAAIPTGQTGTTVPLGNDARFTDARTPTAHTHVKANITDFAHSHVKADVTDLGTIGTAAAKNIPSSGDATGTDVVLASDTRLTNARTPTTHVHAAADISSGIVDLSRLGSTPVAGEFLKAGATTGPADWAAVTKTDVGLSNVPNTDATARANHTGTQAAATITGLATIATSGSATDLGAGTVPQARLGASGTRDTTTFLRGDNTFAAPPAYTLPTNPLAVTELRTTKLDYNPAGAGDITAGVSLNMNGNYVYGVHTPTNVDHALTRGYLDGLTIKMPCRVATVANLAALSGLIAVDTVTVAAGDRVLVKNQTTTSQNGIYVAAAGAWSRAPDNNTAPLMASAAVAVNEGTWTGRIFQNKFKSTDTLGTTGIDWWYLMDNLAGSIAYAPKPTGTPDGTKFFRDDNTWVTPFTPAMDWFNSVAATSIPVTTYTSVITWTRVAGITNPGYLTYPGGSSSIFTVAQAGLYQINFSGTFTAAADGRRLVLIFLNGVEDRRAEIMTSVAATVEISHARYLAVGNTLEFKMYMSGGGALMGVSPGEDMQIIRLA